ncbi:MAG: antitoxin [Erysipelotrichaceae bacterium]|nr:antitoxin [Erysipelotrichaceae bacterium]
MREFDHNGLLKAEYLGNLFERSEELTCSSPVFMRRFIHSDVLKSLDNNVYISFDASESIRSITEQFGETSYGKEKYSKGALFWIGYMYGYISYTREQPVSFVMKLFNYKQMNTVYYVYHTQDPEWCIANLLDINNLSEDVFDNNSRLKKIMKEGYKKRSGD